MIFFVIAHCSFFLNYILFLYTSCSNFINFTFFQTSSNCNINITIEIFLVIILTFLARKWKYLLQSLRFLTQFNTANKAILSIIQTFFNIINIYHLFFNLIFGIYLQELNISCIDFLTLIIAIGWHWSFFLLALSTLFCNHFLVVFHRLTRFFMM